MASDPLRAAVLPLGHQPRPFEDGNVFLHGGEGHVVASGQLGNRCLGGHDPRQDVASRRIGEGPEYLVQRLAHGRAIYNHLVVDTSTGFRAAGGTGRKSSSGHFSAPASLRIPSRMSAGMRGANPSKMPVRAGGVA
jgi:hypothetical protein